jgi:hypothetical protein
VRPPFHHPGVLLSGAQLRAVGVPEREDTELAAAGRRFHTAVFLAATGHVAETTWHQGTDLYAEVRPRLTAALELHSRHQLGERVPASLCGGRAERTTGPHPEVAPHHYRDRPGIDLPQTTELVTRRRPAGTDDLFVAWETLTHAAGPG